MFQCPLVFFEYGLFTVKKIAAQQLQLALCFQKGSKTSPKMSIEAVNNPFFLTLPPHIPPPNIERIYMFETFVVVWANVLTVLALLLFIGQWALRNMPERYKREVCTRLNESRAKFDENTQFSWPELRYACYALLDQCASLYVMCT